MTHTEQQEHFDAFVVLMRETMLRKSSDYANEDRLSNFKGVAAIVGITPEQVALTLVSIKTARLGNLLGKSGSPLNESVADSILDLANYAVLMHMLLIDEQKQEKVWTAVG